MDINYIPVESVQERDVDLLIIEELNVSFDFCKWFIGNLGLDLPTSTKALEVFGLWSWRNRYINFI